MCDSADGGGVGDGVNGVDFGAMGIPTAAALASGVESFMSAQLIGALFMFTAGIIITPWMVHTMRDMLGIRIVNVHGKRGSTHWTNEEGRSMRLWYVGRTSKARAWRDSSTDWEASELRNRFPIWPKGWSKEKRNSYAEDLRLLNDKTLGPQARADLLERVERGKAEWDTGRTLCIERYRDWLKVEVARGLQGSESPAFKELQEIVRELESGEQIALGCWCHPEPCHADVTADAIAYLELAEMDPEELERRFGGKKYRTMIVGNGDAATVGRAVKKSGWKIGEVMSDDANSAGIVWGRESGTNIRLLRNELGEAMKPEWGRGNHRGRGQQADALIAVWDGKSPETKALIDEAREQGLGVFVYRTDQEEIDPEDV